ncbi:MAG: hypothetical protein GF393_10760 [Armatimonadia bacterium]|nr:hypothetical protein [Armatimonadia bacterium]
MTPAPTILTGDVLQRAIVVEPYTGLRRGTVWRVRIGDYYTTAFPTEATAEFVAENMRRAILMEAHAPLFRATESPSEPSVEAARVETQQEHERRREAT